jgi:hypothetical protein
MYVTKPAEGLGGRLHKRCPLKIAGAAIGDHGKREATRIATSLLVYAGRRIGAETNIAGKQNVTEQGQDAILTVATLEL